MNWLRRFLFNRKLRKCSSIIRHLGRDVSNNNIEILYVYNVNEIVKAVNNSNYSIPSRFAGYGIQKVNFDKLFRSDKFEYPVDKDIISKSYESDKYLGAAHSHHCFGLIILDGNVSIRLRCDTYGSRNYSATIVNSSGVDMCNLSIDDVYCLMEIIVPELNRQYRQSLCLIDPERFEAPWITKEIVSK